MLAIPHKSSNLSSLHRLCRLQLGRRLGGQRVCSPSGQNTLKLPRHRLLHQYSRPRALYDAMSDWNRPVAPQLRKVSASTVAIAISLPSPNYSQSIDLKISFLDPRYPMASTHSASTSPVLFILPQTRTNLDSSRFWADSSGSSPVEALSSLLTTASDQVQYLYSNTLLSMSTNSTRSTGSRICVPRTSFSPLCHWLNQVDGLVPWAARPFSLNTVPG